MSELRFPPLPPQELCRSFGNRRELQQRYTMVNAFTGVRRLILYAIRLQRYNNFISWQKKSIFFCVFKMKMKEMSRNGILKEIRIMGIIFSSNTPVPSSKRGSTSPLLPLLSEKGITAPPVALTLMYPKTIKGLG